MKLSLIAAILGAAFAQALLTLGAEPRQKNSWGTFQQLDPHRRYTDVSGKLEIAVSPPFLISSRIAHPQWGAHEQPHLFRMPCGDVHLVFHQDGDVAGARRIVVRSSDCKMWTPMPIGVHRYEAAGVLRDGTALVYDDYAFRKDRDTFVGEMCVSKDGGRTFGPVELAVFHRPPNVASNAMAPEGVVNYKATSAKWSDQCGHGLWRTVLEKKDGTLIACAHTCYQGEEKMRTICYHSTDQGRTWGSESTVAYDPKIPGEGFVEPAMSFCSNGDVLCVMRTEGGLPLMQARSTDGGLTWQRPTETGAFGVDPCLCMLTDGVLACSQGRPGVRMMFSLDGAGRKWTDRLKIYEYTDVRGAPHYSFGYTGLLEVEPGKLLLVYDRQDVYPGQNGKETTAIEGVLITVRKRH
jgi:hypothetical protein